MTVWLSLILFSFLQTDRQNTQSLSYHFSFWGRCAERSNCTVLKVPRRDASSFLFHFFLNPKNFLFPFSFFSESLFPNFFHSPTNPSVPTNAGMLGYMFMGRLMITSAARAVSSNSSPSKVEKEEEELLVSCFIFGKCCENILFLKPKKKENEKFWERNQEQSFRFGPGRLVK